MVKSLCFLGFGVLGFLLVNVHSGHTAKLVDQVTVEQDSIEIMSCMRHARHGRTCVYGQGMKPGCSKSCQDTMIVNTKEVFFKCDYTVLGTVIDIVSSKPIPGMQVEFILGGRHRYITKTQANGSFAIMARPKRAGVAACQVKKDFGSMSSTTDTEKIIILGGYTERFKKANGDLKFEEFNANNFLGETVEITK